jgi:UDP-glucose 4-epimerase
MRCLVTGGAGFIGSHLVDALLAAGHAVTVYDNFATGRREFLRSAGVTPAADRSVVAARVVEADVLDLPALVDAVRGHDVVFHLAANADVRRGPEHPRRDLEQNTIATHNVLEAMRRTGVRRILFASTGSVYGDAPVQPTPEDCPMPVQTSLYGASKLAAEGLISAYAFAFGLQARIFRFVSILGERYTHGHVYDFYLKLRADPDTIEVLGNRSTGSAPSSVSVRGVSIPAAIAAGWATAPSSCSTAPACAGWAGGRRSPSRKRSGARSATCGPTRG